MKKSTVKSITAYKLIRDGILSGEFLPGSRLILTELEKKLGLGRGPIRDALMRLDRSGLVENIPFKGALVKTPPSIRELEYIYETRLTIEKLAIIEAMNKSNSHHISSLQKMINASLKEINIPQNFYFHDRKFHAYLYKIANMPHIQDIINMLNEHIDIFLNTHVYDYAYRAESIRHHQNIVDAMKARDEEKLLQYLEANMTIGLDYLYNRLAEKQALPRA